MKRLASLLALVCVFGCERDKPPKPRSRPIIQVLAVGGGAEQPAVVITEAEVRMELARKRLERQNSLEAAPLSSNLKKQVLDRLVDRRLLLLEANRLKVTVSTAAVAREVARVEGDLGSRQLREHLIATFQTRADLEGSIRDRLLIGALMRKEAHPKVVVSDEEIKAAWEAIPDADKKISQLVRARQIVVRTKEEGNEILGLLKQRHDFGELAAARSLGPEAERGGDLGWFEPGVMPKVFDEVCFSLKPGKISPLTPSEYGFHIFQVVAEEPARDLDLDAVGERLRSKILHGKLQEAEAAFVNAVRARFTIKRDDEALATIE